MEKTYLFYDLETTGLNKCFDQVLQFAAIRTDMELNEIARHEFLVKLNPDVVPSPGAVLTHGITPEFLKAGICEYEAISEIHQLINHPGTISVGYNTLGFDDEFLRFSFYRNLFTPYTHQYANNCGRMDIYPMTVMYYLYKNAALKWPEIDGKMSLKLENINAANDLYDGDAHDAMVDVKVTVELARQLKSYRDMWKYLRGYFDKNADLTRIATLEQAIIVDGSFGADNNYQAPVLKLGTHNHYKNQTLWLRLDLPELCNTVVETIGKTTYVLHKKAGDVYMLLPANERFMSHLGEERLDVVAENKKWLEQNPQIFAEIQNYHKEYKYPAVPNADIDATLYQDPFLSNHEQALCNQFHADSLEEKLVTLERFTNNKLRAQAVRVLGRNYPELLPEPYAAEFADYLQRINPAEDEVALVDYKNAPKLTPKTALQEIDALRQTDLNRQKIELLDNLENYIKTQWD